MGVTTSIDAWDFHNFHVQNELEGGDFVNAASTLLAAGPPNIRFAGNVGTDFNEQTVARRDELNAVAYPIGVVENIAIGQNKQLQRLFEIGSKRSYFVPGRNIISLNMARVLYNGPNTLRMLYAYYPATKINPTVANLLAAGAGRAGKAAPTLRSNPGYADYFGNLDSDLFDQPFGMLVLMLDADSLPYGAIYLENAYVNNYQVTVNSGSVLIAEGVGVQLDRIVPVDVNATARSVAATKSIEEQSA